MWAFFTLEQALQQYTSGNTDPRPAQLALKDHAVFIDQELNQINCSFFWKLAKRTKLFNSFMVLDNQLEYALQQYTSGNTDPRPAKVALNLLKTHREFLCSVLE
jgi:hypothetical protein